MIGVDVGEQGADFVVRAEANGAQQQCHRQLALAVDLDADDVALAGLKLQPGAAAGDQLCRRPGRGRCVRSSSTVK